MLNINNVKTTATYKSRTFVADVYRSAFVRSAAIDVDGVPYAEDICGWTTTEELRGKVREALVAQFGRRVAAELARKLIA